MAQSINEELERLRNQVAEKDRLLAAVHQINQEILSTSDQDALLDALAEQIVKTGIFRSMAVSLVDYESNCVEVVRNYTRNGDVVQKEPSGVVAIQHDLDSKDISAETVRTGQLQVAVEWDERFDGRLSPETHKGQVAYFIPVKKDNRVVMVLATGSLVSEKEETLSKIDIIQPLLDQVVIALDKTRLYSSIQRELAERKQTEEALNEKERFLTFYAQLSLGVLASLDLDDILDNLTEQLIDAGVFRSLMIALVQESDQYVEVVRSLTRTGGAGALHPPYVNEEMIGRRHALDGDDPTAQVACHGQMLVFDSWVEGNEHKAAYFFPVKHGDRVLAVLATASSIAEKDVLLQRIHAMQPLLDQVAVSLVHAQLHQEMQQEVDERKLAERALERSEKLHRGAIEAIGAVPYERDFHSDVYTFVGAGIEELLGYSVEEFTVALWTSLILDRKTIGDVETLRVKREKPESDDGEMNILQAEFLIRTRDGEEKWVLDTAAAMRYEDGHLISTLGMLQDITQQKKVEQEMVRIQRLKATTELSAGISHNLNNILMGIIGPAQVLELSANTLEDKQNIEDILVSAVRARDLVHRFHWSTRGVVDTVSQPVLMNSVIEGAIQKSRPRWKDEAEAKGIVIEVSTQLGELLPIRGDASELEDVLINLLFNAVDAMPDGGVIDIRTQVVDEQVQLSFSDTGQGMSQDVKDRAFEPFFTTKALVGTGLGLYMVYNTVNKWDGTIEVESTLDVGTKFELRFPVWEGAETEDAVAVKISQSRRAKVLVVDDDPVVCRFLNRYLSQFHQVDIKVDGPEALKAFYADRYDVALIDLGLPGMAGDKVAEEMRLIDTRLAMVLISGWELKEDDARRLPFDFHIQKPFDDIRHALDVIAQAVVLHDGRARL